jgi:hypothetical protein
MKKTCSKCKIEKNLEDFAKSKSNDSFGRNYKCKECKNNDYRIKRLLNPKEENRKRNQWYEQKLLKDPDFWKKRYARRKEKVKEANRNYERSNKLQRNARTKLNREVKKGNIHKPENCTLCKEIKKLEAHHEDYNFALNVMWLCIGCHNRLHKIKNGKSYV